MPRPRTAPAHWSAWEPTSPGPSGVYMRVLRVLWLVLLWGYRLTNFIAIYMIYIHLYAHSYKWWWMIKGCWASKVFQSAVVSSQTSERSFICKLQMVHPPCRSIPGRTPNSRAWSTWPIMSMSLTSRANARACLAACSCGTQNGEPTS